VIIRIIFPVKFYLTILSFLFSNFLYSQGSLYWKGLPAGKYAVGFKDSVILKNQEPYKYHSYNGPKPYFAAIWYPAIPDQKLSVLSFGDYFNFSEGKPELKIVADSLKIFWKAGFMDYVICRDFQNRKKLDRDERTEKLFDAISRSNMMGKKGLKNAKGDFEIILFHHGAQGSPYDDILFCEFMASNGYIVVSSNFQWPEEKSDLLNSPKEDDFTFIIENLISSLNKKGKSVYGVGHSMGAQNLILNDSAAVKLFSKIIALHTTLEGKTLEYAREHYWYMMEAFEAGSTKMTTPTYIMAPYYDVDSNDFLPFRENQTTPYTFISVNHEQLTHDGFILYGNVKNPFAEEFQLPDRNFLKAQDIAYKEILNLTLAIIRNDLQPDRINKSFTIRKANH
jgi:hypothetical protein